MGWEMAGIRVGQKTVETRKKQHGCNVPSSAKSLKDVDVVERCFM